MKEKNVKTCFDAIDSISNDLCDEMFVNELEKRLETDPLIPNGLLDLVSTDNLNSQLSSFVCEECHSSSTYTVCKYGTY